MTMRGENFAPIHSRTQRGENATFGNRISLLGYRGMCLLETMDVDRWTGALLTRGRYDALRKQRSGFGARTLPGLPACLRLVDPEVERVLSAVGKTDPILGRTKKDGNNAKRKKRGANRDFFIFQEIITLK